MLRGYNSALDSPRFPDCTIDDTGEFDDSGSCFQRINGVVREWGSKFDGLDRRPNFENRTLKTAGCATRFVSSPPASAGFPSQQFA